jgi:hypothetical protein
MGLDLNSIGALISGGGLSAICKRTKLKQEDVAKVLTAGIPALVGGMKRNAGGKAGADSLSKALSVHSKDDVSDPAAFLKSADLADGKKILGHVLGKDQSGVLEEISKASGVTKGKSTTILALAAPLLLSLLGSQNSSNSSSGNSGGLMGLLGGLLGGGQSSQSSQSQSGSLLGGLLGGSSNSNASMASGLFSSLLGGSNDSSSNTIQITDNNQQQEEQSSGLLDGLLSLFH